MLNWLKTNGPWPNRESNGSNRFKIAQQSSRDASNWYQFHSKLLTRSLICAFIRIAHYEINKFRFLIVELSSWAIRHFIFHRTDHDIPFQRYFAVVSVAQKDSNKLEASTVYWHNSRAMTAIRWWMWCNQRAVESSAIDVISVSLLGAFVSMRATRKNDIVKHFWWNVSLIKRKCARKHETWNYL